MSDSDDGSQWPDGNVVSVLRHDCDHSGSDYRGYMPDHIGETQATDFIIQIIDLAAGNSVVWDFDGVVADTEPLQDATYRLLARRRGHSLPDGYFTQLVGQTEDQIWNTLLRHGFPVSSQDTVQEIQDLKAERRAAFMEISTDELTPSWLARRLMPQLHGIASSQTIVSNGDPAVIESLMADWRLLRFVGIGRRTAGADKADLLSYYCGPGSLLFEDNQGWLAQGKSLGATTIGVLHGYNSETNLHADFVVKL